MRLLIANESFGVVGGTEKYLQSVIPTLRERGHEVCLVYGDQIPAGAENVDSLSKCEHKSLALLGFETLRAKISEWKPDVFYCHGLRSNKLEQSLLSSYPSVLYAHNYYGTCITGTKVNSFPIIRPCNRRFSKTCLLLHLPLRCGGLNPSTAWQDYKIQSQRKRFLAQYQAVLVASNHLFNEYKMHGVCQSKLHLTPLPNTNASPSISRPESRKPGGRLLYIGRLTKLKGVQYLLEAIPKAQRSLPFKIQLTVAGIGTEQGHFQLLARALKVEVQFVGWADQDSRTKMLRDSDLLVVPSVWPEPFGLVGVEAASMGVPAVAFAVGGIPDWLDPGITGESAPGDPPAAGALADAIVRALCDDKHYNSLRQAAWNKARQFQLQTHVKKVESILQESISSRHNSHISEKAIFN